MIALALALIIIPFFLAQSLPRERKAFPQRLALTALFVLGLFLLALTFAQLISYRNSL